MIAVIIVLCVLLAAQQYFLLSQIQNLVDKVMSRSYTEYVAAKAPPIRVKVEDESPEDLRILQEFNIT